MVTTKDFGLITILTANGCQYDDYTVDELGRIWFRYPDTATVRDIEQGFYRNTLTVRVQDFINAQTTMKTLIFNIRKETANGYTYTHGRPSAPAQCA